MYMKNTTEKALGKTPNKETKKQFIERISKEAKKNIGKKFLKQLEYDSNN